MADNKSIGLFPYVFTLPLVKKIEAAGLELVIDAPAKLAVQLRENRLSGCLVSPIDYARDGSLYRIIPNLAVSSRNASHAVLLHFRQGIQTITTLAANPSSIGDIILAKIILAEEFDVSPSIVPVEGSLDAMLTRADAALVTGDEALQLFHKPINGIDLVEAWSEMTDLPYVHGILCFREGLLSGDVVSTLLALPPADESNLASVAKEATATGSGSGMTAATLREFLSAFSYDLSTDVDEGIRELFRYAFYHGVLPDVPELNYFSIKGSGEDHPSSPLQ